MASSARSSGCSRFSVATIDDIKMLERRLDALEEGIKRASSISL